MLIVRLVVGTDGGVVHILSADLTLRKRTMQPVKTLIYGLRRFDLERTAAALAVSGAPAGPVQGYMSPKTKVYLVRDSRWFDDD